MEEICRQILRGERPYNTGNIDTSILTLFNLEELLIIYRYTCDSDPEFCLIKDILMYGDLNNYYNIEILLKRVCGCIIVLPYFNRDNLEELKDIITRLKENLGSVSTMIEILSKAIEGIKHQSKDLRDLLIYFREMEKIQSKISGFKSRIKFPKIEKAVPFVITEIKQSKETPTLSQIAASSEFQNFEKKLQLDFANIYPNLKTQYTKEVEMDPTKGIIAGTPWLGSLVDLKPAGQTMGYGYEWELEMVCFLHQHKCLDLLLCLLLD